MSVEKVLSNTILEQLRINGLISENEVVISVGDIYYAKNVLSDQKRIVESAIIDQVSNVTINEILLSLIGLYKIWKEKNKIKQL